MKYFLFVITILFSTEFSVAQELSARVFVNYEKLETASKERLEDFAKVIEDYLNQNKFTGDAWEGEPIDCSFNIFFTSGTSDLNYSAQVVVTSQRPIYKTNRNSLMLRIQDGKWKFNYEQNQILYFDPTVFDPLTSFLDFYAYLIIGFDMDSYEPFGGSDYFARAYDIAVLGSGSNADGWQLNSSTYNRRALVEDLRDSDLQRFREDYFDYHYNGLDEFYSNKEKAQKNIAKLVMHLNEDLDKINRRSVLLRVFFNAKHAEIANYLSDYPDKNIFKILKKIDPPHISTYDKILLGEE